MAGATALLSKADAEETPQKAYNYYLDALQTIIHDLRLKDEARTAEIEYSLLIPQFNDAKLCLEKALNLAITAFVPETRKPPLLPCQSPDCQIVGLDKEDKAKPLVPPRPAKSKAAAAVKAARSHGENGITTSDPDALPSDKTAAMPPTITARRQRHSISECSPSTSTIAVREMYLPKQSFAFNGRQCPLERPLLPLHAHPVVREGTVDPTNLVAAQTGSDCLEMTIGVSFERVPLIPVSPLVTLHRQTHARMEEASAKLDDIAAFAYSDQVHDLDAVQLEAEAAGKLRATVESCRAALAKNSTLIQLARSTMSLLSFPAHLLAYQLTLIDQSFFLQIDPNAILTHSPKTPDPAIAASTDFFNYVTRMVEHCILAPSEANVRAQVVHHWIKVASRLYDLRNFQTMKAVTSALSTPPIVRLSKTWSCVPRKSNAKLEELRATMSEDGNYSRYREATINCSSSSSTGTDRYTRPPDSLSQWEVVDIVPNQNAAQFTVNTVGPIKSFSAHSPSSPIASPTSFFPTAEARKPEIPFLGVFILDSTYIQAMTSSGTTTGALSGSLSGPDSPTVASVAAMTNPSPHLSDLLSRLAYYQRGPRYTPTPPAAFMKMATRSQSRRLHRHLFLYSHPVVPVEEDELAVTQSVIMHWVLTRDWVDERVIDDLSRIRESKSKGDDRERRSRRASFEVEKLLAGSSFTGQHSEESGRALSPSTASHSLLLPSALPATASPNILLRRKTEPYSQQASPQADVERETSSPKRNRSLSRLSSPSLNGPSLPPRPVLPSPIDDRPDFGMVRHPGKDDDSGHVVMKRGSEYSKFSTSAPDLVNGASVSDNAIHNVRDSVFMEQPSEWQSNRSTPCASNEDVNTAVLNPSPEAASDIFPDISPLTSHTEENVILSSKKSGCNAAGSKSLLEKSPLLTSSRKIIKDPVNLKGDSNLSCTPLPPKLPPRPFRKTSLSTEIQNNVALARD